MNGQRVIAALAILIGGSVAAGQLITLPTGLSNGDEYRLAFLTSLMRDGQARDIDVYDSFVQNVAASSPDLAMLNLEWKALASTREVDARDNTESNPFKDGLGVPIYLLDGDLLAPNYALLWDPLEAPISRMFNVNELGEVMLESTGTEFQIDDGLLVWTGSNPNGTATQQPLGQRGRAVGSGNATALQPHWISAEGTSSVRELPLYALSEVISVVPEPSSGTCVAMLCVLGFSVCRKISVGRNP